MAKNNFKKKSSEELRQEFEALTEKLYQGVTDYLTSDKYKQVLDNISRFHQYSVSNSILILLQRPYASYVASFTDWKNKFNRSVNPGEKGLKIIMPTKYRVNVVTDKLDSVTHQPMVDEDGNKIKEVKQVDHIGFKVGYTYDLSMTSHIEGKPEIDIQITKELTGDLDDKLLLKAIKQSSDVPIHYEDIPGMAKGYFSDSDQKIVIKKGLSEVQEAKSLIHEITHSIFDNSKADALRKDMNIELDEEVKREESEIIAESTAYLVMTHYGYDTVGVDYSFPYVGSWARENPKVILACLDTIKKTANEIIKRIDMNLETLKYEFQPDLQEKSVMVGDKEIFVQLNSDNDFDYTIYNSNGKEIDGGVLDNDEGLGYIPNNVFTEIIDMHNLSNKEIYYAYVYNDDGKHFGRIPIEGTCENAANFIMQNCNHPVVITDTLDQLVVSSTVGGFLDRVVDPSYREKILEAIYPLQVGDKEIADIKYVVDTPELYELANELDDCAKNYDFYDYQDNNDYPEKVYDDIVSSLRKGGKELSGIKEFLNEVKTESENSEELIKADILLNKIEKFESSNIKLIIEDNKIQHKMRMA